LSGLIEGGEVRRTDLRLETLHTDHLSSKERQLSGRAERRNNKMTTSPTPGTGTGQGTPVIDTPGTRFTSAAGFSAAIAAALAGALAVLQGLDVLEISEPVKIALIGLVGAGILAWAIAAAGDSLARAYALAHVTRKEGEENQPAIQTATNKLVEVYGAAHGITITDGKLTPAAQPAPQGEVTPLPTPLKVKLRGKDAQAIAIRVSGESGKETQRYLVGLPDSQLTWVSSDAISLPAPPTPATPAPVAPTPATPAPSVSGDSPPPSNGSTTN